MGAENIKSTFRVFNRGLNATSKPDKVFGESSACILPLILHWLY